MPGTIVFKPIEANLTLKAGPIDPYCTFIIGDQKVKGSTIDKGAKGLHWNDSVTLKVKNQPKCYVELKDEEDKAHDFIGNFEVDLREIESNGNVKKWFTIYHDDKREAGEILLEARFISDIFPSEESQKAAQGNVPIGVDLEREIQDRLRLGIEPENSLAKTDQTNEFGDYQPTKQLNSGDLLHERGSGMIEQGQYYSGTQTSYGESYPMVHKSVAVNMKTHEDYGVIPRGDNPLDYARFQNQAFVPHTDPNADLPNPSVVEKAFKSSKEEEARKNRGLRTNHGEMNDLKNLRPSSPNSYSVEKEANLQEEKKTADVAKDQDKTYEKTQPAEPKPAQVTADSQEMTKGIGMGGNDEFLNSQNNSRPSTAQTDNSDNKDFRDIKRSQQKI